MFAMTIKILHLVLAVITFQKWCNHHFIGPSLVEQKVYFRNKGV